MNFDQFKPLREAIEREALSRQQVVDLLGTLIGRVCRMEAPELEPVQHDLSEAHEAFVATLAAVEEREARRPSKEVDEMDLARIARACGAA